MEKLYENKIKRRKILQTHLLESSGFLLQIDL
ncbi:MAG: hypothetical protein JWR87_2776 [Segetibacter sp.]|nr:hypothetical protein [Segetibacter sp.]